jgi:peptide/nickel transport system permease protein
VSATAVPPPAAVVPAERDIERSDTLRRLLKTPTFTVGALVVLFWIACAFLGSRITPDDPLAQSADTLHKPSGSHLFGTDQLGRDVLSRVLAGAHDILLVCPAATLLGIAGGAALGLITGYYGGIVDDILGRITDAVLALPLIIVAFTAITSLGSSDLVLILVIGFAFTPIVARSVRAAVLGETELEYVQAAKLRGENSLYVMFVEILPNIVGPIIVEATVRLGYAIFAVAGLTFLGVGVQPPSPDWALQVSDNYGLLSATAANGYYWTVLFPALGVASLIVAVNLVADGLQQVLDR